MWWFPGTGFNARVLDNGRLHINMFGNTVDPYTGKLVIDRAEMRQLFPLKRSPDLSGAVLSSTDIYLPFSEIANAPRDARLRTMLDIYDTNNKNLLHTFGSTVRQNNTFGQVAGFSNYSPSSLQIELNTAANKGKVLFYPYPEELFRLNSLNTEKVVNDIQEEILKALKGESNELLSFFPNLNKSQQNAVLEEIKDMAGKIKAGSENYETGLSKLSSSLKPDIKEIIANTDKYPAMKVAEDLMRNPTQATLDAFNNFYSKIPGFRPIRFDEHGQLIGYFPTVVYKKNGGNLLQRKRRSFRLQGWYRR